MSGIVAREEELACVHAFVDDVRGSPSALVLEGEAGIGKSTLWLAGVAHAHARGMRVVSSRPAEAERGLALVGLGDLFEAVLDEVLPALPAPRRRALEAALLLQEAPPDAVDPRALGLATRDALQVLGEDKPVLVAIDDLQWLDSSSAAALTFALRRLGAKPVRLLLARRLVEGGERSELERPLGLESVRRLAVGSLSVGALHRFLRDRLGRPFARQTLLRIHERSGGNPFFALELARVLDAEIDPARPLPVPETLEELVRARTRATAMSTCFGTKRTCPQKRLPSRFSRRTRRDGSTRRLPAAARSKPQGRALAGRSTVPEKARISGLSQVARALAGRPKRPSRRIRPAASLDRVCRIGGLPGVQARIARARPG